MRSLETGRCGLGEVPGQPHFAPAESDVEEIRSHLATPRGDRIDWIRSALVTGMTPADIHEYTGIDPHEGRIERLRERWPWARLRWIALAGHIFVVSTVFLSHLHYTIDVIGAWAITYCVFVELQLISAVFKGVGLGDCIMRELAFFSHWDKSNA